MYGVQQHPACRLYRPDDRQRAGVRPDEHRLRRVVVERLQVRGRSETAAQSAHPATYPAPDRWQRIVDQWTSPTANMDMREIADFARGYELPCVAELREQHGHLLIGMLDKCRGVAVAALNVHLLRAHGLDGALAQEPR